MAKIYVITQQEYHNSDYAFTTPKFCFSKKGKANDQLDELVRKVESGEYWAMDEPPSYTLEGDTVVHSDMVIRRATFRDAKHGCRLTFEIRCLELDNGYGI